MVQRDAPNLFTQSLLKDAIRSLTPTTVYLDRRPEVFPFIIDWLSEYKIFPITRHTDITVEMILEEAVYFKLGKLEHECREWLESDDVSFPAYPLGEGDHAIFSNRRLISFSDARRAGNVADSEVNKPLEEVISLEDSPFILFSFRDLQLRVSRQPERLTEDPPSSPAFLAVRMKIHFQRRDDRIKGTNTNLVFEAESANVCRVVFKDENVRMLDFAAWVCHTSAGRAIQYSGGFESDLHSHIPWREFTNSRIVFELPIPFAIGFWRKRRLYLTWMQIGEPGWVDWVVEE